MSGEAKYIHSELTNYGQSVYVTKPPKTRKNVYRFKYNIYATFKDYIKIANNTIIRLVENKNEDTFGCLVVHMC